MSSTLTIENFGSLNIKASSVLAADIVKGATTITLTDTADFSTGDVVVVGSRGAEGCDAVTIQSVDSTTQLTFTAGIGHAHSRFEPVAALFGSQIRIYRAPNVSGTQPADTSFVLLTPVTMDTSKLSTTYIDAAGGSSYWYKFTYYNGSDETSLASSGARRGGGYGHYTSLDEVRRVAGFSNNPFISDAAIDSRRIDAESEIDTALGGLYSLPFSPVPPIIAELAKEIAAGLLQADDYGPYTSGASKEGSSRLSDARARLAALATGNPSLKGADGATLLIATGVSGTTGDDPYFTMDADY